MNEQGPTPDDLEPKEESFELATQTRIAMQIEMFRYHGIDSDDDAVQAWVEENSAKFADYVEQHLDLARDWEAGKEEEVLNLLLIAEEQGFPLDEAA